MDFKKLAKNYDFNEFYQLSGFKDKLKAKIIYEKFKPINENRENIFKAIFFVGVPCSGKDYILKHFNENYIEIDANHIGNLGNSKLHENVKSVLNHRNNIVVNVNGLISKERIFYLKECLEELDYSTMLVFVNTTDKISKERNFARMNSGGRIIQESIRKERYIQSHNNLNEYKSIFKNYTVINNNTKKIHESSIEPIFKFSNLNLTKEQKIWKIRNKQMNEKNYDVGSPEGVINAANHIPGQGKLVSIEILRKKYRSPFNDKKYLPKDKKNV